MSLVLYLVKHSGDFTYFTSHTIKKRLKNTATLLHGVSAYLPNLEALCLECVWNTCSATTISSLRPRPLSGQKYIPMSPLDS
jgi:hypothetical protein